MDAVQFVFNLDECSDIINSFPERRNVILHFGLKSQLQKFHGSFEEKEMELTNSPNIFATTLEIPNDTELCTFYFTVDERELISNDYPKMSLNCQGDIVKLRNQRLINIVINSHESTDFA